MKPITNTYVISNGNNSGTNLLATSIGTKITIIIEMTPTNRL